MLSFVHQIVWPNHVVPNQVVDVDVQHDVNDQHDEDDLNDVQHDDDVDSEQLHS